jgi:hypothetical protein
MDSDSETVGLYPNFRRIEMYEPENIPAEFSNDRKIFLPFELQVLVDDGDWVREAYWDVCSKRPYIWERPYDYKIEDYKPWFDIYAYACVEKFGFITSEQYHELYKTRAGRKVLRNRVKTFRCLVWYRRDDDAGPAPVIGEHKRKRIVPASRVLSFFPGA